MMQGGMGHWVTWLAPVPSTLLPHLTEHYDAAWCMLDSLSGDIRLE